MKKVIAAVVGSVFALASLGSFAATPASQPQAKTQQVAVHKAKAKHVKAKKHTVRHAKKAHRSA